MLSTGKCCERSDHFTSTILCNFAVSTGNFLCFIKWMYQVFSSTFSFSICGLLKVCWSVLLLLKTAIEFQIHLLRMEISKEHFLSWTHAASCGSWWICISSAWPMLLSFYGRTLFMHPHILCFSFHLIGLYKCVCVSWVLFTYHTGFCGICGNHKN